MKAIQVEYFDFARGICLICKTVSGKEAAARFKTYETPEEVASHLRRLAEKIEEKNA